MRLRELVALAGRLSGHPRPIIGLGDTLSCAQAFALELLPGKLMSRDNLASMKVDNVSSAPFPFGIRPAAIEAVAPDWFGEATPARPLQRLPRTRRASVLTQRPRMAQYTLVIGNKAYSSWSLRPWLVMKQAGMAFDEVRIPLYQDGHDAKIRKFSPAGKVPVLVDGDITVWDSLAICEYLAERHPRQAAVAGRSGGARARRAPSAPKCMPDSPRCAPTWA